MFLAQLVDFGSLVPVALFGMFAAVSWWVLELVATGKSRALERLDELKNPHARRSESELAALRKADTMTKVLQRATPALARPLEPKSELELSKLRSKLSSAGFRSESASRVFLGLKFLGMILGLALGTGAFAGFSGLSQKTLFCGIAVGGFFFYLPNVVIWFLAKRRMDGIFRGLPDALDMMVVCVEAGLGLDQAMRRVSEEMRRTYWVISDEFGVANFQLQMGRPRNDVLHELGIRTGVSDLRSLAAVIIQADKFGSSIAQALRVQSDSMRTRRRQIAEEKAAKTAVKLIFPLVLFIFPGIFVVLVGPAAITMVNQLFPNMGGG
ncbi:MAG: type II secretion system F family protein [Thermoguttaceae bacterium]